MTFIAFAVIAAFGELKATLIAIELEFEHSWLAAFEVIEAIVARGAELECSCPCCSVAAG